MFVVTGVLESMERDDAKSLIERYGGKVTGNISKKTTYLVQGRDGGVSKLEKVTDRPDRGESQSSRKKLNIQIYAKLKSKITVYVGAKVSNQYLSFTVTFSVSVR